MKILASHKAQKEMACKKKRQHHSHCLSESMAHPQSCSPPCSHIPKMSLSDELRVPDTKEEVSVHIFFVITSQITRTEK